MCVCVYVYKEYLYVYIYIYMQGVAPKIDRTCDAEGLFFGESLILSVVLKGKASKNRPFFRATPLQTAARMKFHKI